MSDSPIEPTGSDVPPVPVRPVAPTVVMDAAGPSPAPPTSGGGISVAALVLGIAAAVSAVIPGLSFATWAPAGVAIVLGIITLARHRPTKRRGVAAIILGAAAWLVSIIVSIVFIVALGGAAASHTSSLGTPTKVAPPTAASAAPSAAPSASAAPVVTADSVYSGTGDSVLAITLPNGLDTPAAATITGAGADNFTVWSLDSNAKQQDLLVNTIGAYSGTVLMDARTGEQTTSLQISSGGAWTVTVHPLANLRQFSTGAITGTGDDVVIYRGTAGAAALTNSGSSNFTVWTYGDRSDLVVNEIGNYTGTDLWQAGPSLVAVTSDGPWSITLP